VEFRISRWSWNDPSKKRGVTVLSRQGTLTRWEQGAGARKGRRVKPTPPQPALLVSYTHIAIATLLEVYDSEDDGPAILSDLANNSPVQRPTNFLSI
jgi:hypothetical protein